MNCNNCKHTERTDRFKEISQYCEGEKKDYRTPEEWEELTIEGLERAADMECCKNCKHRAKLIMWEKRDGRYLPNYNKPLVCCTALVDEDVVYGHTDATHNGMCEMFVMRGEE